MKGFSFLAVLMFATFLIPNLAQTAPTAQIGVYRPATGQWFLDSTGNLAWDGCEADQCLIQFGSPTDQPVCGDWTGSGAVRIGVYRPKTGQWFLDSNGNGLWDGCGTDTCFAGFGARDDQPVAGDIDADGIDEVGVFRPSTGQWFFDRNNNGLWDGCGTERCLTQFGSSIDLPVIGDMNGDGTPDVGVFRPGTGYWYFDLDHSGTWSGCGPDGCFGPFGGSGDRPVVGDWTGTGVSRIGVYRPINGGWYTDLNGNYQWDGCIQDGCGQFGAPGDLPVAGKWSSISPPQQHFTLTVDVTGTGFGTVRSTPIGIDCGIDCSENYVEGTLVTLTASPEPGSVFDGFSGGCSSIEPTCTLTITENTIVTAIMNTGLPNTAPTADAGPDKNYLTGLTIYLDGSNSADFEGDTLSFAWNLLSKPDGSDAWLEGAATEMASFMADTDGRYDFSLIVNDGSVDSEPDFITIVAITPGAPTAPLSDTGQTTSYSTRFGEDSDYVNIPMSFTDNSDGTVTDNVTGLIWQKDYLSSYNWFEATGTPDVVYNPGGAINVCGSLSLAGQTNWRVPTRKELVSIANYGTYSPAIDTVYFPNTQYSIASSYWSATTYSGDYCWAWGSFDGRVLISDKTNETSFNNVRCVNGEIIDRDFVENGDGTITEIGSVLIWQKEDDGIQRYWDDALTYCEDLVFAGYSDWRLPDIKELDSIVDSSKYNPSIDTNYFYNTFSSFYWSSTTREYTPDLAFGVDFERGEITSKNKTTLNLTRCVR